MGQDTGKGEFYMFAPTFLNIDATKDITLADLTVKENDTKATATKPLFGNNKLLIFGNYGDPQYIIDDDTLADNFPDAYAKFSEDEEAELAFTFASNKGHWYMSVDTGMEFPMDDYPMVAGRGCYMNSANSLSKGYKTTIAGGVGDEDIEVEVGKGEFFLTGNVAPATMALKEFTVRENDTKATATKPLFGNNKLLIFGNYGDPQYIIDDETLEENFPEAYAKFSADEEAELAFTFASNKGHWYMSVDTGMEFPMDDYPIVAGRGLYSNAANSLSKGMTLTLPPAIEKSAK